MSARIETQPQRGHHTAFACANVLFVAFAYGFSWINLPAALTIVSGIGFLLVTSRRTLERIGAQSSELQSQLSRYASVVNNSQDAIYCRSNDGAITFWNRSAELLYGYQAWEAMGRQADFICAPDEIGNERESFNMVLNGEWVAPFDAAHLTTDKKRIDVSLNESPIFNQNGEIIGVTTIVRDISERIASRRALEESAHELRKVNESLRDSYKRAEAAARSKSEFLTNISHEIRTPMTAIMGFCDVLEEQNASSRSALDAIDTIQRNGGHLLAIIDDILDLSRLDTNQLELELEPTALPELVSDLIDRALERTEKKNIAISAEFTHIPKSIHTDPARLDQILHNLLTNAVKFTESGSVRLHIDYQAPKVGDEVGILDFAVTDTGIGIKPEQLTTLFEPFTQADASMTRRYGGTGLGLAICQRLARLLGAELLVESQPDVGSCFTLRMPVPHADIELETPQQPCRSTARRAKRPTGRDLEGIHVLLAEDGLDNQRLISFVLKKAGAQVVVASNGQEAYDFAIGSLPQFRRRATDPTEEFDVVLMDMQMPVMDGYTATRKLREFGYDCPIIAVTAHAMVGDREKCLDAGCDDYTTKPVDREQLLNLIKNHVFAQSAT